ncbi:Transposase [Paeniglutamicibacter gangotriensis Lz1y]|uniref:Transposase n=1 Tax=Paeniglutamicibacter gangotriensis Lz1y TaxID=1276920 RepID=M7MZG6_9MICC|nr:Transposase [Paeniglutamicibacter gangotriensis Lz1y]
MPESLRTVEVPEAQVAELSMLCGFDDDLAKQATTTSNRIRGLLTHIHPALRQAGETRIGALLRKHAPRAWNRWAWDITAT